MYDGTGSLKMIGNDCKQLELNINKFLVKFLRDGEKWSSLTFLSMVQISELYIKLRGITRCVVLFITKLLG